MNDIPNIVNALAWREGKTPISWFVADDHVTIVYASGEKIRYLEPELEAELETELEKIPPASKKLPAVKPSAPASRKLPARKPRK
jgi:hypothetical protein